MKNTSSFEQSIPERISQQLFIATNSCNLEASLETLIEASKSIEGRSNLASQNILPCVLELIQCVIHTSGDVLLLSSLKLLRNLCAGEIRNQNVFIEQNGVGVVSRILQDAMQMYDPNLVIIRLGLQVLANVSLAGKEHQKEIWHGLFPDKFLLLARIPNHEVSDPLSMIIYLCSRHSELVASFCGDSGLPIMEEIVRTASSGKLLDFLLTFWFIFSFYISSLSSFIFSLECLICFHTPFWGFCSWFCRRLGEVASFKNLLRRTLFSNAFL